MAKKTKTTRVVKTKRPRSSDRGWLVLRRKWGKLFKDFYTLSLQTGRYVFVSGVLRFQNFLLILLGLVLMGMWLNQWWYKNAEVRISQQNLLKTQLDTVKIADKPHPTHIFIKWFVDAPITDGTLVGNTWTLSDTAAVYLIQSARPNTLGNAIIYGHNTREMMGNIRALKGYERIILTLSDGSKKEYKIKDMHQVTPESVSYIQPTDTEILTLFTCAGFADKERFVVRAVPI